MLLTAIVLFVVVTFLSQRYAWWRSAVDYRHPRILMYHMVREHRPGAAFNKLRVPPAAFEAQLAWLSSRGWHFATMSELGSGDALPTKTVVLTFDDGYEDNLLNADAVLKRYGARATLYLVEDRVDRDWSTSKKAHHDSGELMEEPKLSDDQLRSMIDSGRWELGGHTRTHANLASVSSEARRREIIDARTTLAAQFDVPVESFAYPFGIYGPEDVATVRDAGFTTAVTTEEGIAPQPYEHPLELPRIKVSGKDGLFAFRLRLRSGRRGL
ncbi:MAG: polysaccharide deacetylase family protein [Pseudomonadota bacterium]